MTDHLATGMKRMIRTVARSASLSDRLGERSRLLRLTGNRSTLDFRPAEHGASSWDFEMSITPTEPKPYGNAETREPVWRETVDSATYGESRARVAHAVETFRIYDNTGILPETENCSTRCTPRCAIPTSHGTRNSMPANPSSPATSIP